MKLSHRLLLVALSIPFVLAAIGAVVWIVHGARIELQDRAFLALAEGATQREVVAAMGTPTRERACGESLWWGDDAHYRGKNTGACITEARYEYFLVAYGVGYSAERKVVSKYRYVSE